MVATTALGLLAVALWATVLVLLLDPQLPHEDVLWPYGGDER